MTLSEIEARKQEINKELTALKQKIDEYFHLYEHLDVKYHSCHAVCPGSDYWKAQCPEEAELQGFQSKIYALEDELKELDNKKFQLKVNAIKDSNRLIDEEYLKSFPNHLGVKHITITYKTDKSVGILCSDSKFFTLVSNIGVCPDLAEGQSIYG